MPATLSDAELIAARAAIENPLFTLHALKDKYIIVDRDAAEKLQLTEQELMDFYADLYGTDIHLVIGAISKLKPELITRSISYE